MKELLITDCIGQKAQGIKAGFTNAYGAVGIKTITTGFKKPAPYSRKKTFEMVTERLDLLRNHPSDEPGYAVTIQKGFYSSNDAWYLTGMIGILLPDNSVKRVFLKEVKLPDSVSREMNISPAKHQYAMRIAYPGQTETPYYELLTNIKEAAWITAGVEELIKKIQ